MGSQPISLKNSLILAVVAWLIWEGWVALKGEFNVENFMIGTLFAVIIALVNYILQLQDARRSETTTVSPTDKDSIN